MLAGERLDALDVLGRKIGPQADDDAAVFGLEEHRILRIEAGRHRCGEHGHDADERNQEGEHTGHGDSLAQAPDLPANLDLRRRATAAGTKAETSPPIAAIWRTSVAVMGRTIGEAGRNTVCTSGAMASFMPAICISSSRSVPS